MNAAQAKVAYGEGKITQEQYLEILEGENARLSKAQEFGTITLKVSEKGGVSVYGLGRFPVTLFKSQWIRLLAHANQIVAFIKENEAILTVKGDKKVA